MRNCQGAEKQMEEKRRKRKESVQMEMNNGTVSAVWRRFRLMGNRGRLKVYGMMRWCLDSPETAAFWCLLVACLVLIMLFGLIFWLIQLFNPPSMTTVGELPTEKLAASKPYNSTKAQSIVESLCSEWRSGRYAGDFCETLCHGDVGISRNWTLADYTRGGNKHVMKLRIDGLDTVLKMQFPFANEYDQQIDFDLVDEEQFTDKLLEIVNEHLQLGWPRRHKGFLLRKIWPALTADVGATGHRRWRALDVAEKRSVWALLQQDEFITSAVLQMSRVTPRLLGVCGHAYLVEYLVPFRMKPYYLNLKAKILVHLMGTLKLFYEFLNEPFQWCDVKFDNLGLSANYPKRFVVMDSDMLYTESRLNTMLQTQKCSNDTECGLFDCASQCNTTTGYCTGRTNSNLEVFCKKLIIQQLFGTYWSKSNRYLSVCHEPGTYSDHLKSLQLTWAWSLSDV